MRNGPCALVWACILMSGCGGASAPVFPERHYETELTPEEAFARYLADFQRDPRDEKARSQVIDLAGKMNPRPTRPPQVEILAGKAVAAIKQASRPADFEDAAQTFEQASRLAPWVGSFYNNAAVAFEKAGKPEEAIRYYLWYLQAAPADPEAPKIRAHIGELQFEADKRTKFKNQIASLEGVRWTFSNRDAFGDPFVTNLVVQEGRLVWIGRKGTRIIWAAIPPSFETDEDPEVLKRHWPMYVSMKHKFSADLETITETTTSNTGEVTELKYFRRGGK